MSVLGSILVQSPCIRTLCTTDAQDTFINSLSFTHTNSDTHSLTHTNNRRSVALNLPVHKNEHANTNCVTTSETPCHTTEGEGRRQTSHPGAAMGFHASLNLGTLFGVFIVPPRPNLKGIPPPGGPCHEWSLYCA